MSHVIVLGAIQESLVYPWQSLPWEIIGTSKTSSRVPIKGICANHQVPHKESNKGRKIAERKELVERWKGYSREKSVGGKITPFKAAISKVSRL